MAIIAAQQYLQAQIGTQLQKGSYVDHFYLDEYANAGVRPAGFFALSLSNGFLRASPAPVFEYADERSIDDGSWTAFEVGTTFTTDLPLGRLAVQEVFSGKWVRATYDAGFQAGDTIPDWMNEAIAALVPAILQFGSVAIAQGSDSPATKLAVDHANTVIQQYKRRTYGIVIRPS
jgi:hypothetical protein